MSTLRLLAAAAALGIGSICAEPAAADPNDPIVMSGLNNPRGLTFAETAGRDYAHHGGIRAALYVAEAGTGGTLRCTVIRGTVCVGRTGSVSRYWRGRQQRIVEGLPSYAPFAPPSPGAVGPSDVSFAGGRGYVVIGLAANPDARAALAENFGWIARFRDNGKVSYEVDVSDHEKQENPDAGPVESNPHGLLEGAGKHVVVDAAGNTVLAVAPWGRIFTGAVIPSRPQGRSTDAVPTSIAIGPDRAFYIGELTGAPFIAGQANIWRLVPGRAPQIFCSGFSYIIDLDFDRHGNLYVLEHASGANGPFADPLHRPALGGRVQLEAEQRVDIAADERERRPQLVRDRREEARAELVGGQLGPEVAEHDDRPRLAAGHRRERGGDRDLGAVGADEAQLRVHDPGRALEHLLEPAPRAAAEGAGRGVGRGRHVTAEELATGGRRIVAAVAEQRRGRAIDAHDAPFVVHGDDAVVGAIEDRGQERLLAGEGVAQLGGAEGDRELVADERQQPDPVRRQRGAVRRPERDEPDGPRSLAGLAQLPALVQRHAVPATPRTQASASAGDAK